MRRSFPDTEESKNPADVIRYRSNFRHPKSVPAIPTVLNCRLQFLYLGWCLFLFSSFLSSLSWSFVLFLTLYSSIPPGSVHCLEREDSSFPRPLCPCCTLIIMSVRMATSQMKASSQRLAQVSRHFSTSRAARQEIQDAYIISGSRTPTGKVGCSA